MKNYETLFHFYDNCASVPAILAFGSSPLTYGRLCRQADYVRETLATWGLREGDRVALVLPPGPEIAVCLLVLVNFVTSVPVDPNLTSADLEATLGAVGAKAVIVDSHRAEAVKQIVARTGIRLVELSIPPDASAGEFELHSGQGLTATSVDGPRTPEIVMVLGSSGTTSKPKYAPLTYTNLRARCEVMKSRLQLTKDDRCLNFQPMFTSAGMHCLFASAYSGGSTVCVRELSLSGHFETLLRFEPSYYAASPTVHRAMLELAKENPEAVKALKLRFIRSSAGSLPAELKRDLAETFGVPVINVYASTEAGFMASSHFPGNAEATNLEDLHALDELEIQGDDGTVLPCGEIGEVFVRGVKVISGYENNPEADAEYFRNGWYRTGDLGSIDASGFLRLSGRKSERINRGGQTILPDEIDKALLDHPDIIDAVAFPVPHPTLGEIVGAAAVMRDRAQTTERDVLEFLQERLVPEKIPRRIIFMDRIPKGPAGKAQRSKLAELLRK